MAAIGRFEAERRNACAAATPPKKGEHKWRLPECKPVSVPLRVTVIRLDRTLLYGSSDLPGSPTGRAAPSPLFGLAPRGVFPAGGITPAAVRSYRTISPLPPVAGGRYIFCGTIRKASRPSRPLAGTPPCGDRTFLSRCRKRLSVRQPHFFIVAFRGPITRFADRYNRKVRIVTTLILALCLAGCNHSSQNKEAVRQAIVDHLQAGHFDMSRMSMDVKAVQFNGTRADATVSIYIKGSSAADGMSMTYQLEQQGGKWVVLGAPKGAGGMPHAGAAAPGAAMPGAENPHGAMPAPPAGGTMMPSPGDLPPAGQKK